MTIPNVTMVWCRKKAKCRHCDQTIEIGNSMVRVYFWRKGDAEVRKWNWQSCYHPECWVKQGLEYLDKNPFVPHKRGRRITLNPEDRRKRFLLVRKFNELYQRKSNVMAEYPDNLPIEANLVNQMTQVMKDVAKLGGVPKSWAEKIV